MAWSQGSQIFEEIASALRANVSDFADRVDVYRELISIFEDYGADLSDAYGCDEAFDEVWREHYGDSSEEE